jgi:hypothetical protein
MFTVTSKMVHFPKEIPHIKNKIKTTTPLNPLLNLINLTITPDLLFLILAKREEVRGMK